MKIDIGSKIKDISIVSSDNKKKLSDYLNKNLILYLNSIKGISGCLTNLRLIQVFQRVGFFTKMNQIFALPSRETEIE